MALSPTGRITILIADDHALFREALRKVLETDPELSIAGEAADGRDAVRLAAELRPDIVLLDLRMPQTAGLEALREIARVTPSTRTLVLTASLGETDLIDALKLGARGVVMKDSTPTLLVKGIRSVMAGEYWVSRDCIGELVERARDRRTSDEAAADGSAFGLTPREQQIVAAVLEGCSNDEIAAKYAVTAKTVKHHLTNIYSKLGVSNRVELALLAVHRGFDTGRLPE